MVPFNSYNSVIKTFKLNLEELLCFRVVLPAASHSRSFMEILDCDDPSSYYFYFSFLKFLNLVSVFLSSVGLKGIFSVSLSGFA